MINADGSLEDVALSSDWLAWGTYGDDWFPVVFHHDPAGAKICNDRLSLFMPLDPEQPVPEPTNPIERGLADLWRRTAGPMPDGARAQFRVAVEDMTSSWVWELLNDVQHRVPDPVDYIEMRRRTFGADMTASLTRLKHSASVAPEIYRTRVMRELETAAQDYACFLNDLFSYQKEIQFDGEIHNLVLVVERFLEVDRLTARDVVADLMRARMEQFEHIVATGLPALFADAQLDEDAQRILTRHAEDLKEWMSGILEWHRRCPRYPEAELVRTRTPAPSGFSFLPTGPGTSALRPVG